MYVIKNISDNSKLKCVLVPKSFINDKVIISAKFNYNIELIRYSIHSNCPSFIFTFKKIFRASFDKNIDFNLNIENINNEFSKNYINN